MSTTTSKSMPLVALAALAALVALLVAGCGGGSSDSTDAAVESQPPPTAETPAATGEAEGGGDATPREKQVAAKKPSSKQAGQKTRDRENAKAQPVADGKEKAAGGEKRTAKTVDQKVEAIIRGAEGGGDGKQVVSSPEEIRKVLDELKEDAGQGGNASEPNSVEQTLEKVLGGS